ncbi:transcriptional regulator [Alicycliphilus denitrificans]|uniref:Transcriptional regulator n=1 Tax=Alicycliphilus denitrificans TaxID=179636 RepID=A0A420KEA2_9BURK|nr:transcriptional regulator [Alicycliphilus denitrificans]RKJ98253.1 transcriptional regulator [Alicycliphilus denitrificans]HRP21880.1 transcriptional regulator [Alicycliphilus sp.]
MNEKIEFSNRLRQAMADAGYAASPSVLEQEFNLRWYGRSISNQAAWNWLNSKAVPTQDKIQVLAEWLKVEPEVLRFGEAVRHSVQEYRQRWDEGVGYLERETFDAFLRLPAPQRKLIREVILTFAQVHGRASRDIAADETRQK